MIKSDRSDLNFHTLIFLFILLVFGFSSCISKVNDTHINARVEDKNQTSSSATSTFGYKFNKNPTHTQTPIVTIDDLNHIDDLFEGTDSELNEDEKLSDLVAFRVCSPLASEEIEQLSEIISDPYKPPPPGRDERHHGVDFSYYRREERIGIEGEVVQSILPGVVSAVINNRLPYGNMVIIETPGENLPDALRTELKIDFGESLYHLYAHMIEPPLVNLLDNVECGQKIGMVGSTGYYVVNAHLHLETRIGPQDIVFDGMVFYDTSASQIEMDNYRRWRTGGEFIHFDPMTLFQYFIDNQ
jgi:murein DD-endopeptidase MepM/ murein hydrolase activator NlpD